MQNRISKLLVIFLSIGMLFNGLPLNDLIAYAEDEVVKIDRLSVSVRDGGKDVNGKYTWVTDGKEDSKDHRFTFRINYVISGTYDYEAEGVQIKIPKNILRNRDGDFADYYDMSVPEWNDPDLEDITDFVYKEVKEKVDPEDPNSEEVKYILIYNRIPVPGGTNGFIEVSYLTTERTWEYLDMGKSDDFFATMHVEQGHHADPEDETSTDTYIEANKDSNKIPVYIDTTAKITNIDKQTPQKLYRSWQDGWGTAVKPDNPDDYFYLVWPIRTWITANQPYNFDIEDIFTAKNGFVVGYSLTNGNFKETYPVQYLKENYSNYSRYDYVLTAHPKADYQEEEWEVKNSVRGHVDPYDQVDDDTYANDNAIFRYKTPKWEEPTGHFMLSKKGYKYSGEVTYNPPQYYHYDSYGWNGGDSSEIRSYKLDQFKEGEINEITDLKYRVLQIGYAYPWTRNSTLQDPSAFGHNPVKYVVTDNELFIGKLGNNNNDVVLDWQDANIYKLDFNFTLYDANFDEEELRFSQGPRVTEFKDSEWMDFYVETKNSGEYVKIARWNPQNGEYTSVNNSYIESASGKTITFNRNDITGWKIEHSNARYHTAINVYPYVTLHNTDKVMNFIGEDMKIYVKDFADSKVYDYQNNEIVQFNDKMGYNYAMGIQTDGHITKKVKDTRNNKVKKNYVITWESSAYESFHDEEAVFRATEQSSGTFYDLLPLGGEYVNESIKVYGYKDGTLSEYNNAYQGGTKFEIEDFDISIKENYKKSGRDLLTVKINEPAEYYTIVYDSVHTWNNIKDYGKDVVNNIAYETGNEKIGDGQIDGSNNIFGNLDPDVGNAKKFLYEDAQHHISLITNALLNLKKQIRASGDEHYSYKTKTYPDSDYYYNIRFATDDETTATDLMVMDSLENYTTASGETSAWRGYLKGINVKEIELLGANPKIYYSSVPNLDLEKYKNRTDYPDTNSVLADKIDDESVWVDEETFGDPANATAFLVDIRTKQGGGKFILDYDTGVSMTVAMRSPKEVGALDHYNAYNNIYLWDTVHSKDGDVLEDSLVHQDFTQITYVVTADIPIHKVSAKDNSVVIKGTKWELKGDSIYGNTMDQEGTTDANGNYTFKKIEAGTYTLRETYVNNDYFINPTTYTVIIGMDGSVQVGDGTEEIEGNIVVTNPLDTDNNRFVLTNEVRVHGDLEFTKVGLTLGDKGDELTELIKSKNVGEEFQLDEYTYILESKSPNGAVLQKISNNLNRRGSHDNIDYSAEAGSFSISLDFESITNAKGEELLSPDYIEFTQLGSILDILNSLKEEVFALHAGEAITLATNCKFIGWAENEEDREIFNNAKIEYVCFRDPTQQYGPDGYIRVSDIINFSFLEMKYQRLPNTTFKLTGTSDYGTEYNEYVTSTSRGKVSFKDIEKGTYELIETKPNEDYINPNIKYTVTVDENGNVSIDGEDLIETENGETVLQNEAWHNFSLRKTDAVNGGYLEGAEFKLVGTDEYGKEVDMHETSNSNGRVTFDPLASGTYILQETKAPKNYEANPKKYVVEIDRLGNVKIDGLSQDEQGFFVFPDPRGQDGKIKIIKKWNDGKTGEDAENRDLPEITISTKEPEAKKGISVTKRWEGDTPEDRPDNIIVRLVKKIFGNEGTKYCLQDSDEYSNNGMYYYHDLNLKAEKDDVVILTLSDIDNRETIFETVITNEDINNGYIDFYIEAGVNSSGREYNSGTYRISIDANGNWSYCQSPYHGGTADSGPDATPGAITVDVIKGSSKTSYKIVEDSRKWTDNRNGIWTYDFNHTQEDDDEYYVYEEPVDGYLSDALVDAMKEVVNGVVEIVNKSFSATELYAEFDSSNGILRIFRDDKNKYTDNEIIDTKTYYKGLEDAAFLWPKWYDHNSSITKVIIEDAFVPKSTSSMFRDCTNLTEIQGMEKMDTSNSTSMSRMFYNCHNLISLDLSNFNTENVTNMALMFMYCGVTNLDVSSFNTVNVTNMLNMFGCCYNLVEIQGLERFNTSNVTTMDHMFASCHNLATLDLSSFDTGNVTITKQMFENCHSLTNLDISTWNTNSITDMSYMFHGCENLTELDLSSFDTSAAVHINHMFWNCSNLVHIYVSDKWDVDNASYDSVMFTGCENLPNFNPSIVDKTKAHYGEDGYLTYKEVPAQSSVNHSMSTRSAPKLLNNTRGKEENYTPKPADWGEAYAVYDDTDKSFMLFRAEGTEEELQDLDWIQLYETACYATKDEKFYFKGFENIYNLRYDKLWTRNWSDATAPEEISDKIKYVEKVVIKDIIRPKSCYRMFEAFGRKLSIGHSTTDYSTVAEMIGIENLDTSKCTTMHQMFEYARFSGLNLTNFDTSNVTDMHGMFTGCMVAELDLSSFDTSKVSQSAMRYMFDDCMVKILDISSIDMSNVGNEYLSHGCLSYLECINIGPNVSNVLFYPEQDSYWFRSNLKQKWERIALSNGKLTHGDVQLETLMDYDNSAPGWYKLKGTIAPNEADFYDIYKTSDDISKWVKIDDETWEYTFDVFDDEALYYAWESEIPYGYTTDTDRNNYQIINDGKGNYKQVTIMNTKNEINEEKSSLEVQKIVDSFEPKSYTVEYEAEVDTEEVIDKKYSHTSNISDSGEQNGNYDNNLNTNDIITIDGADKLHVKITYATESTSYDWACVWEGNHTDYTATSDYDSSISGKLGGTTKTTKEYDIEGDSVTIGFKSDSSVTNYGYYAEITGIKCGKENRIIRETIPKDVKFTFDIEIEGLTGTQVFNDVIFKEGKATVYLRPNEKIRFTDLPKDVNYTIIERPDGDYPLESSEGDTGTLEGGETVKAVFVNKKVPEEERLEDTNGFKLKKNIEGGFALFTDKFDFIVSLSGLVPNRQYNYGEGLSFISSEDGTAEINIKLGKDEEVEFEALPIGSRYTITELANEYVPSYTVSETNNKWNLIEKGQGSGNKEENLNTANEIVDEDEDITIQFTNTKEGFLPTGIKTNKHFIFILIAGLLIAILVIKKYRRAIN